MQYSSLSGHSNSKVSLYPDAFFSLSDHYMPSNIKRLFKWCEYYYYKDPIIGDGINKLANFPVTDFIYNAQNDEKGNISKRWKDVLETKLDLKSVLIRAGLDLFTFGNHFLSLKFGHTKILQCENCGNLLDISNNDNYDEYWEIDFSSKEELLYEFTCPECGSHTKTTCMEQPSNKIEDINIVRWDPNQISIKYYNLTGESRYFYDIPQKDKDYILNGDKHYIKSLSNFYVLGAIQNKKILLERSNLFHYKRSTLSSGDQGWGKPLIIHSLQRLFYLNLLRRAQEAVASERIIPHDFFFPLKTDTSSAMGQVIDLPFTMEKIRKELEAHRRDPNYQTVFPMPIGYQRAGGDGRNLLLTPEIDQGNKEVCTGMGIPLEFVFGGLTWSGSSVSLRLLENTLRAHIGSNQRLINFVVKQIKVVTNLPKITVKQKDLKMADDIQRIQLALQLNAQNKLSDQELLSQVGFDINEEWEKIKGEQTTKDNIMKKQLVAQANAQGEVGIINAKFQAKAQVENQKTINQSTEDLKATMPQLQREARELEDKLNLLNLQITETQMEAQLQNPAPPQAPAEEEGGGQAPAPEGGQAPPPEEGQAPPGQNQEQQAVEQAAGAAGSEPPAVHAQQWNNPFYQGEPGVDIHRWVSHQATRLSKLDPATRASQLHAIQIQYPKLYGLIIEKMNMIPGGGTASEGDDVMKPIPENRPPRREGGGGIIP